MAVDEQGVTFEFEAPKCDIGDRCLEMVRRGDYSGCSFEFYPKDYEVERTKGADGKDEVIIRHKSLSSCRLSPSAWTLPTSTQSTPAKWIS